jgi:methyltransferase
MIDSLDPGAGLHLYFALLAAVGAGRLAELHLSRRNRRRLIEAGARPAPDPAYPWIVALHTGILAGAGFEAALLDRPLVPPLAATAGIAVAAANLLRWWAVRSLRGQWNARILAPPGLTVSSGGPYRWIRHPNYAALLVELAALPLIHGAWWTAAVGTACHALVLRKRIAAEEPILATMPGYAAVMGGKPRFVPRLRARRRDP